MKPVEHLEPVPAFRLLIPIQAREIIRFNFKGETAQVLFGFLLAAYAAAVTLRRNGKIGPAGGIG